MGPVWMVLRARAEFWDRVSGERRLGDLIGALLAFIVVSSAVYGAILAGWRSGLLSLYVAVKLPGLMVGTTSLVMVLNWMSALAAGSGLSFRQVVAVTYGAMAVACWILLSLAPVTAFFTFGVAGDGGSPEALRLAHNHLLLMHVTLIAFAGVAGNAALRQGLSRVVRPGASAGRIYWGWLVAFAVVGCQLSWILRPFVGSPFYEVRFMRPDALDRNFFEFVLLEVLPYALKGGD